MESSRKKGKIRGFNKSNLLNWIVSFENNGMVMCSFKNCNFMAFDIEVMADHYSFCTGDVSWINFKCNHCSGGTDTKDNFLKHKILQHSDLATLSDFKEFAEKEETLFPKSKGDCCISRVILRSWELFLQCKKYIKCLVPTCLFITSSIDNMQIHYQHYCTPKFREDFIHTCQTCGGRTNEIQELVEHCKMSHPERLKKNSVTPNILSYWSQNLQKYNWAKCINSDCQFIDCDIITLRSHYEFCLTGSKRGLLECTKCGGWLKGFQRFRIHSTTGHSSLFMCLNYKFIYMRPVCIQRDCIVPIHMNNNSEEIKSESIEDIVNNFSELLKNDQISTSWSIGDIIKKFFKGDNSKLNLCQTLKMIKERNAADSSNENQSIDCQIKNKADTLIDPSMSNWSDPDEPTSINDLKMTDGKQSVLTSCAGPGRFNCHIYQDDDNNGLWESTVDEPLLIDSDDERPQKKFPQISLKPGNIVLTQKTISPLETRSVSDELRGSWLEAVSKGSPVFCPLMNCDFRCLTVNQIEMHYISCQNTQEGKNKRIADQCEETDSDTCIGLQRLKVKRTYKPTSALLRKQPSLQQIKPSPPNKVSGNSCEKLSKKPSNSFSKGLVETDAWKLALPGVIVTNRNYKKKRKRTIDQEATLKTTLGKIAEQVVKDDTQLVPVSIKIDHQNSGWTLNVPTSKIDPQSLNVLLRNEIKEDKKLIKVDSTVETFKETFWKNIEANMLELLNISVKNSAIRNKHIYRTYLTKNNQWKDCNYETYDRHMTDNSAPTRIELLDDHISCYDSDGLTVIYSSDETEECIKNCPPRNGFSKQPLFTHFSKAKSNNSKFNINNSVKSYSNDDFSNIHPKVIDNQEKAKNSIKSNTKRTKKSAVRLKSRKNKKLKKKNLKSNKSGKTIANRRSINKAEIVCKEQNNIDTSLSHNSMTNDINKGCANPSHPNVNTEISYDKDSNKSQIDLKTNRKRLKDLSVVKKESDLETFIKNENDTGNEHVSSDKVVETKLNIDMRGEEKADISSKTVETEEGPRYKSMLRNYLTKNQSKRKISSVIYTDGEHSNTDDDGSDTPPPPIKLYPDSNGEDNDDSLCIKNITPITSSTDNLKFSNSEDSLSASTKDKDDSKTYIINNGSSSGLADDGNLSKDECIQNNLNSSLSDLTVAKDNTTKNGKMENPLLEEGKTDQVLKSVNDIKVEPTEILGDDSSNSNNVQNEGSPVNLNSGSSNKTTIKNDSVPDNIGSDCSGNDVGMSEIKTVRRGRKKGRPRKILSSSEHVESPSFGSLWGIHFQVNPNVAPAATKEKDSETTVADNTAAIQDTPVTVKNRPARRKKQQESLIVVPEKDISDTPAAGESSILSRPRRKRTRPITLYEELILPNLDLSNIDSEDGTPVPSQLIELPKEKRKRTPRSNRAIDILNSLGDRICPGSFLKNPSKIVKCAICQETMSALVYQNKHQLDHNFICWLDNEKPLPIDDQGVMMLVVNRGVRMHRSHILRCGKCKQTVKSASGFLSHVRFCGKSQEEASQLMAQCHLCERLYKPQCLEMHVKNAHGPTSKDIQIPLPQNTPPSCVLRHPALQSHMNMDDVTGVVNTEEEISTNQAGTPDPPPSFSFNRVRAVPRKLKASWKEAMARGSPVFCPITNCDFRCESVEQIQMHYISCNPVIKNQVSTCKMCQYTCSSKEVYKIHMKNEHCIIANPIENTAHFPIKALKDLEDEVYCTFSSVRYTTFFKPCLQLTKQLRAKILCPLKEVVHPDLRVVWENWESIQDDPRSDFIPIYHSSPAVQFSSSNDWIRLPVYGTLPSKGESLMWAGGRVRSLAWCPTPSGRLSLQYLAVACQLDFNANYTSGFVCKQPATIQLWNYGLLLNCGGTGMSEDSEKVPQLSYIMCMDDGPIWDLDWCPSGCYDPTRLGLLACATASGTVNIYAMPHPSQINLPEDSCPQFKGVASLKLLLKRNESHQCQSISWSKVKPHKTVVGGFVNGLIAVWDLCVSSTFLREGSILYPTRLFQGHFSEITCVRMCPADNDFLLTGSLDKTIKLWDLKDTSYPVHALTRGCITDMEWLTHWIGFAAGMDAGCLPTPSSVFFASLRDFSFQPAPLIGHSSASAMSVSGCDWMNCLVTGYEDGNIILTVGLRQLGDGSEAKKKVSKFVLRTEVLDLEEAENSKQKVTMDSSSYEETINMFGLKITLSSMIEEKKMEPVEEPRHDIFPIQAINKICFNPNEQSFLAMAIGYESGFVSVPHLTVPKHLITSIQRMAPPITTSNMSSINDFSN